MPQYEWQVEAFSTVQINKMIRERKSVPYPKKYLAFGQFKSKLGYKTGI